MYKNSDARGRVLRRLKEEMVDWASQPLFRPRFTKTVGYELTPEVKARRKSALVSQRGTSRSLSRVLRRLR